MVLRRSTSYAGGNNRPPMTVQTSAAALEPSTKLVAIACGVGAAMCWAGGLVAARHAISIGLSPADLAFHRFVLSGLVFLPFVARDGFRDLGGLGWPFGILFMIIGGPGLSMLSHAGFILAPLGHGAVIQPSVATLSGILLATIFLKEPLSRARIFGVFAIVGGLCLMGIDAVLNIGTHALGGDLAFVSAGLCWATFLLLMRRKGLDSMRATAIICALSLLFYAPVQWLVFGFDRMIAVGWWENLLQIVMQGVLSGPLAIYLSGRAAIVLGAGRGATFSALVPPFTMLTGAVMLGEIPSVLQLAGLVVFAVGFRFAMQR